MARRARPAFALGPSYPLPELASLVRPLLRQGFVSRAPILGERRSCSGEEQVRGLKKSKLANVRKTRGSPPHAE